MNLACEQTGYGYRAAGTCATVATVSYNGFCRWALGLTKALHITPSYTHPDYTSSYTYPVYTVHPAAGRSVGWGSGWITDRANSDNASFRWFLLACAKAEDDAVYDQT